MALDPSTFAPQGESSVPLSDFIAAYDEAITRADAQVAAAKGRVQNARATLAAIPAGIVNDDARKAATDEVAKAETTLEAATKETVDAGTRKAQAIERYSQRSNIAPELRDRYAAMADAERASVQQKQAENFEFLNAIPEKRAQLHATTLETQANAAVAQAKADVAAATTDIEKQAAQTRLDQANAALQSTQLANTRAGLENKVAAATAAVAPRVAEAGAVSTESKAAIDKANADNAVATSAANLTKTQADAAKAQLDLRTAQANFDALTPEMRTQAAQADLDAKKLAVQTTQQALQLAQDTHDTVVAQGKANVAATEAGTQKGLLGAMYGLQDRVKEIANAFRSGQITDPAEMQRQLQSYIETTVAGTTPFEAQTTALGALNTQRQQDFSLAASQGSTFGSGFGTALSQFSKLNDTTPVGSDAAGRGFLASMDLLGNRLKSFAPAENPLNSALVRSIAGMGGVSVPSAGAPAPAAAVSAPTTTIQPDGTVTIQHTSAPTAAGLLPPGAAGTAADPNTGGASNPAFLNAGDPALPQHLGNFWDNDPNLHPELATSAGGGGAGGGLRVM